MSYSNLFNSKAKANFEFLSMSGEALEAGLQSLNNVNEDEKSKKRKKKADKHYYDLLQLLTETQIKLQDFIDEIDIKLIQARLDLQLHKDMLAERIALEHCIEVLDNDSLLERNADGTLKDKNLERAVTRYLKDNNMNMDLSDDARIYAVAQNLLSTYLTQDQLLDIISLDKEIISTMEDGKDQAQTLQSKLNDPDISKQEIKQISKQADRLGRKLDDKVEYLTMNRNSLFNLNPAKVMSENIGMNFSNGQNTLHEKCETNTLPQSMLNF